MAVFVIDKEIHAQKKHTTEVPSPYLKLLPSPPPPLPFHPAWSDHPHKQHIIVLLVLIICKNIIRGALIACTLFNAILRNVF